MAKTDGSSSYSSQMILFMQLACYASSLIFSLLVCVPMAMHQEHFKGHCLLFSTGEWQERDGQFNVQWASQAYCNFTIFVAVVTFLLSVGFGARTIKYIKTGSDASFFAAFCELMADGFLVLLGFVAAIFVTCGFQTWCGEMTRRFPRCKEAAGNPIDKADDIDSTAFFIQFQIATFGIWGAFTFLFAGLVLAGLKVFRYHYQENLRVSMAKERKRLINNRDDMVEPNQPESAVNPVEDNTENPQIRRPVVAGSSNEPHSFEVTAEVEVVQSNEEPEDEGPRADLSPQVRGNQIQIVDDEEDDDDDQRDFFKSRR